MAVAVVDSTEFGETSTRPPPLLLLLPQFTVFCCKLIKFGTVAVLVAGVELLVLLLLLIVASAAAAFDCGM